MFTKTFVRAIVLSAVLVAGGLVFAAMKVHKMAQAETCSEAEGDCQKPKAQGEFIILEALNRAVSATGL